MLKIYKKRIVSLSVKTTGQQKRKETERSKGESQHSYSYLLPIIQIGQLGIDFVFIKKSSCEFTFKYSAFCQSRLLCVSIGSFIKSTYRVHKRLYQNNMCMRVAPAATSVHASLSFPYSALLAQSVHRFEFTNCLCYLLYL